jgi:antitoxin (DNA-binding transcriptional repressor) of toxin-antitoxin stability system
MIENRNRAGKWCNMNVADAEKNFAKLVDKVYVEGISIDLERDDKVIARLTPAEPRSPLTVGELNAFLRNLPSLGDDADDFAQDVRAIRAEFPAEANPWD